MRQKREDCFWHGEGKAQEPIAFSSLQRSMVR